MKGRKQIPRLLHCQDNPNYSMQKEQSGDFSYAVFAISVAKQWVKREKKILYAIINLML